MRHRNMNVFSIMIYPSECFFGVDAHVSLDRNPIPGYNTLILWLIPGDLFNACPRRQFHTLAFKHSRAALSNSYPNACVKCWDAVCTNFMMVFVMTRPRRAPTTYRTGGGYTNNLVIPIYLCYHVTKLTPAGEGLKFAGYLSDKTATFMALNNLEV